MLSLNKKTIFFVCACLFLIVGYFVFIYFAFVPTEPKKNSKPETTASSLERDYSLINRLTPGKDTLQDVIRINGKPVKTISENGGVYLYYDTPTSGLKNKVFIKNNVVAYAVEYVFGNYRGSFDNYTKNYGSPSLVLYQDSDYPWYVFLKQGLMVQSTNNFISAVVYFIPQEEDTFFKNLAPEFSLSKSNLESARGEALPTPEP